MNKYVVREWYGGRLGRQRPDGRGLRYRVRLCGADMCDRWVVDWMGSGTREWSDVPFAHYPTRELALDRVTYERARSER